MVTHVKCARGRKRDGGTPAPPSAPAVEWCVLTLGGRFASSMAGDERLDVGTRPEFGFGGERSIERSGQAAADEETEIALAGRAHCFGDPSAIWRFYRRRGRQGEPTCVVVRAV